MDGTPVWSKEMEVLEYRHGWGGGASPVLHDDRLYIVNDNEGQSFLAAYDKHTGEELLARRPRRGQQLGHAVHLGEQRPHRDRHRRHRQGALLRPRRRAAVGAHRHDLDHVAHAVRKHGLLYVSSGFLADAVRPVYAIRPGAIGDITLGEGRDRNEYIAWSNPKLGTYSTSALVYGDFHYTLLDRGFLICTDARTGREVYSRKRIARRATAFTASLWAYNDKVFALSEEGETFVIQAGPEYELLGSNDLDEMAMATPGPSPTGA